jgi:hypothetical protein
MDSLQETHTFDIPASRYGVACYYRFYQLLVVKKEGTAHIAYSVIPLIMLWQLHTDMAHSNCAPLPLGPAHPVKGQGMSLLLPHRWFYTFPPIGGEGVATRRKGAISEL